MEDIATQLQLRPSLILDFLNWYLVQLPSLVIVSSLIQKRMMISRVNNFFKRNRIKHGISIGDQVWFSLNHNRHLMKHDFYDIEIKKETKITLSLKKVTIKTSNKCQIVNESDYYDLPLSFLLNNNLKQVYIDHDGLVSTRLEPRVRLDFDSIVDEWKLL